MGVELFKKYVSSSMIICYRSVLRHPFLVCMVLFLVWMQQLFPLFFSFLVSSSPVIVSTAVLLGTLLSYGQPNIPEIEKEPKSEQYEIQKLESKVTSQTEIIGRDGNFASEETNGSRIEIGDKSFEVINPVNEDSSCVEVNKPLDLVDEGEYVTEVKSGEFGEEHLVDEAQNEKDEVKVVLGSHYTPLKQSDDEHIVLENDDKLWEGSADPLNSDPALLWKRVEGDGYDDDEDDDDDDGSDSDLAESSSPDASMADIIPLLDELHPLLSEEQELRQEHNHVDENHEDSEESIDSSESSSSESDNEDGVKTHDNLEPADEENKEFKHTDKEDETRSAITWTEDDQKNLMNLGTSELERNRHLENLIARRRAQKTHEDLDSEDLESEDEEHEDEEDKEDKHTDKEDEPITWTEDDQKNLMNLGTSELERNRHLEDLIARRMAQKTHEDIESGDEEHEDEEDKEDKHTDKEDEPKSAITWTEDDQKNLMNLGTSELERNRRLENLIARRRARNTMRMQAEKNLIDLDTADFPWNSIPPISTARSNPFDYDANDNIPGSAPSVLLKRRNPFDLPYDSSEEKPDLVGDTFQQEFLGFQPKEPIFRRHESFNVGPSNFGGLRSERQETKLRPYFVPERVFQRQFSGISDSVPDTESVSSGDHETKDHEDELSLEPEVGSEKEQEHEELIHERPYFVPEHVDSVVFERQLSEVSDSKLSSVPDSESVSSVSDHETKNLEDELSLEPEVGSEKDEENDELIHESHERSYFVPEHVDSGTLERQSSEVSDSKESVSSSSSDDDDVENKDHIDLSQEPELISFEDDDNVESVQVPERDVEGEVIVGNVQNQQEEVNDAVHSSSTSSLSSSNEESEQIYNEKEGDEVATTSVSETNYYFEDHGGNLIERSEIDVTSLLAEESRLKEPVYDTSPRSVTRNLSSSSICNDLKEDVSERVQSLPPSEGTGSLESQQETVPTIEMESRSITDHGLNELELKLVEDNQHKDESFQHIEDQHESSSSEDVVFDMNASQQLEEVEVPSSSFNGDSHESSHQVVQVSGRSVTEDVEEVQVQELEVTLSNSEPQFTEVVHEETYEPSEEDLELLQQIQEPGNEMSLSINSVLNDEPEVVGIEDIDNEIDEELLVELDAVGDFSFSDIVSSLNDMEELDDPHVVEDEDSCSKDLGSVLNEMDHNLDEEEDSHSKDLALDHDLRTEHSGNEEDSYSKDLGATVDEMKQDPHGLDHDLETKLSGDEEDSYSEAIGSHLNDEMKQDPHALDLETKISGDEESYSKDSESSLNEKEGGHNTLETFYSVDEYAFSKIVESTLNEMKYEPQALEHVLESNPSGDEDLLNEKEETAGANTSEAIKTKLMNDTNEMELPQETESNSTKVTMVNHETENASTTSNMDKE